MSSSSDPDARAGGAQAEPVDGLSLENCDREILRAVLKSSLDAIIVTDQDARIIRFNKGAEAIFGYSEAEIAGQPIELLVPEDLRAAHAQHVSSFLKGSQNSLMMAARTRIEGRRRDGSKFPAAASVTRQALESGTLVCVILRDISESVARQEAMRELKDEAIAASRAKSNFLATMSHEIRSPLHGILGMIQLLKLSAASERQRQQIEVAEQSGNLLLDLINDAIDLSKVEAGFVELQCETLNLIELVREVVSGFRSAAARKGIALSMKFDEACPDLIFIDPLRFRQILTNLIGNAVKFTERGNVEIAVRPEGVDHIHISVNDTGIGLAPGDQKRIFNRFAQADPSIERRFGGSGLGLSIVKELVALMGGEIGVHSVLGEGSEFWISIPLHRQEIGEGDTRLRLERPALAARTEEARQLGAGKVALVVDDIEANRLVCASMLEGLGFATIVCASGAEALAALGTHRIDLVCLDLHMPMMSGVRCTREIRRTQEKWSHVPIVILTADTTGDELASALSAGANEYCFKPFNLSELAAASEKALASGPLHLVLIDDDPVEHDLLAGLCSELDRPVRLEHFRSADEYGRRGVGDPASVVLLDGRIPPISSHRESLEILARHMCGAEIYLLSSDKPVSCPDIEGLNIVSAVDKLDLYRLEHLKRFVQSIADRRSGRREQA